MRIGIFGCTADPFTEAHTAIVSELLTKHIVDRVVIAPTIVDYHRKGKKPWLTEEQKLDIMRIRLLNSAELNKLPPFKAGYWDIWDRDFKTREICSVTDSLRDKYISGHRFIDTLIEIIKHYEWNYAGDKRGNEYFVVIGSDSYQNIKTWSMWEDIIKLAKLIVVKGRTGTTVPSAADGYPPCIEIEIDKKYANVSATKERKKWQDRGYEVYKQHVVDSVNLTENRESSSGKLLHTPIFDVVRGKKTKTGLEPVLVDAPDWVSLIVEKNSKVLVEKQFRYGSASVVEEFPCGMVEKGEDPFDAAVRELEEETGIKLLDKTQISKIGSVSPNPAFMTNTMHYFYVNLDTARYKRTSQKLDAHEQLSFYFKDIDSFCQKVMVNVASGKQKIPAMLVTAIALYGFRQLENQV